MVKSYSTVEGITHLIISKTSLKIVSTICGYISLGGAYVIIGVDISLFALYFLFITVVIFII